MKTSPTNKLAALLGLLLVAVLAMPALAGHPLAPWSGEVVGVSDGDTLKVMRNGRAVKVRVAEIDTPERRQPFGTRAKQFTSDLCFGQVVKVVPQEKDRYGRVVARVVLTDGRDLSEELVRAGLAWHYKRYSNDGHLEVLESEARATRRGLWAAPEAVPPWEWRARTR